MKRLILLIFAISAWSPFCCQAQIHHYLYVATAPECPTSGSGCSGTPSVSLSYPATAGYINVYDIDASHTRISTITLPSTVQSIRGLSADVASNALYLPNYGNTNVAGNITGARLLRLNLTTNATVWDVAYTGGTQLDAIDRGCADSTGSFFWAPSGENNFTGTYKSSWYRFNASDGSLNSTVALASGAIRPHNTICDTGVVYMGAIDQDPTRVSAVAKFTISGATQVKIPAGNYAAGTARVRPFTVDKVNGLVYSNVEDFIGFVVADTSGNVKFDYNGTDSGTFSTHLSPNSTTCPAFGGQPGGSNNVRSHGIALTPNGTTLYVADQLYHLVHVYDVSGVRSGTAPTYLKCIATTRSHGAAIYSGNVPGWLSMDFRGKFVYPETGDVIDTATDTITTHLADPNQRDGTGWAVSRYMLEVTFNGSTPIQAGEQFGTGHVVPPAVTNGAAAAPGSTAITIAGSVVTATGGQAVSSEGVCYATTPNPTSPCTSDGTATPFTSNISGLTSGTLYHYRAFVTNLFGTGYGVDRSFTTTGGASAPTVTTTAPSSITTTTASAGGNVTSDGGSSVTARGTAYGPAANPDITGSHTTAGSGTGVFTSSLSSLTAGTVYHVRGYATSSVGTSYGGDLTFTTTASGGSPTITMVFPADADIGGTNYILSCNIVGISTLAYVQYFIDGSPGPYARATEPHSCPSAHWNTYLVGNGQHSFYVIGYDALGNVLATSSAIGDIVENYLPQQSCLYSDEPTSACGDVLVSALPTTALTTNTAVTWVMHSANFKNNGSTPVAGSPSIRSGVTGSANETTLHGRIRLAIMPCATCFRARQRHNSG
jgi:hypothetical protein